jgi:AraC family transcriptional regulator
MALEKLQPVLKFAAEHPDGDVSLQALAREVGLSPFHLHRMFSAVAGETPKQYTLRLRLDRAAGRLLTSRNTALDIALECGFQSHEVFSRAFRRRFGINPAAYRKRGFVSPIDGSQALRHVEVVVQSGPCIGLYRHRDAGLSGEEMEYSITKREIASQPVLAVRRRVKPDAMAAALSEMFGEIFVFAQGSGAAMAGQPLTRFVEWGPGLITIDGCLPIAAPFTGDVRGNVRADTLPGGPVATMIHTGPYDKLIGAHAAMQQWIEAQGFVAQGAPWEAYITDPAEYPDPNDWKTEIFWPLAG